MGLAPPACVTVATSKYRERMDPLLGWLEDECLIDELAIYPVSEAYPAYVAWAKRNALGRRETLGRNTFKDAMEARGFRQRQGREKGGYAWVGVMRRVVAESGEPAFVNNSAF